LAVSSPPSGEKASVAGIARATSRYPGLPRKLLNGHVRALIINDQGKPMRSRRWRYLEGLRPDESGWEGGHRNGFIPRGKRRYEKWPITRDGGKAIVEMIALARFLGIGQL
jgi:hypothetical protein